VWNDEKFFALRQFETSKNYPSPSPNVPATNYADRTLQHISCPEGMVVSVAVTHAGKTPLNFVPQGINIGKDVFCE